MHARGKIAVAGATGRVGRHVVDVLEERGHHVVPMSRSSGVDVVTGEGLADALAGVATIIDVATQPSPDEDAATAFFTATTRNLQEVGARAGEQIIVVSIIGIDRFTAGYYAAKLVEERAMLSGPIPVRILRAAQFHELRVERASDPAFPESHLYETGALLPSPHATLAGPTFEEWLKSETN